MNRSVPTNHGANPSQTNESAKDFVVKLHNDGKARDDILVEYARRWHGRQAPNDSDKQFVDQALTNLEG